jgi:hypothetical protein
MFPDIVQDCTTRRTTFDITPVVENVPVDNADAHFQDSPTITVTCRPLGECPINVQTRAERVINSAEPLRRLVRAWLLWARGILGAPGGRVSAQTDSMSSVPLRRHGNAL